MVSSLLRPYKKVAYWLILLSFSLAIPELFMAGATSQFIDSFLLEVGKILHFLLFGFR